jgi:MFS family permease
MTEVSRSLSRWGRFGLLWGPQTLSVTARGLTTFALGVWVFEKTHSATLYTLLSVCALLPGLLATPFLGVLTDRLGPRRSLLLADGVGVLVGGAVALAFVFGLASPPLLYLLLTVDALAIAMHWPAYTALVTLVAPEDQLPRAAALMQLGYAGQGVLAPMLGGLLLNVVGVNGLVAVDVGTTLLALAAVFRLSVSWTPAVRGDTVWREVRAAVGIIRDRGLLGLAGYILATYLPGGLVLALATPLVLTLAPPSTLGVVLSIMGAGMLVGSVVASALARPEGGIRRLLAYDSLLAAAMLFAGVARTPVLIAVLGFVFLFGLGGLMAEEQAIWQLRVPVEAQGRVFAIRRMLTWASLPVSYGLAGPLADHLFEPAMTPGGRLATSLGAWMGTGPGRGIALLLVCGGLVKGLLVLWGARHVPLLEGRSASEGELLPGSDGS